jgi:hypothetical protein
LDTDSGGSLDQDVSKEKMSRNEEITGFEAI